MYAQKADMKYQKNETKIKFKQKKIANFIFNFCVNRVDCLNVSNSFGICFIFTISLYDNPRFLTIYA